MGIYSGKRVVNGDEASIVPDLNGDVLAFPYFEAGQVVAEKYRGRQAPDGSKVMWQRVGGRKTFYNADILDDPSLIDGSNALVIVEGEPDVLAVISAGYPFVASVPDGAVPDRDAQGNPLPAVPAHANDIDPNADDKFRFIVNNWDRLKKIKRFVLMLDGDGPGMRMRDELARRLGRVRCSFVEYPEGSKDANEVLLAHGADAVLRMIGKAPLFPIRGIYRMSEFPDPPEIKPVTTGWGRLDLPVQDGMAGLMLEQGLFMTVLGAPEAGKSTWTTQLAANVARLHGWIVGIATFEMKVKPYMQKLLRQAYFEKPVANLRPEDMAKADRFIDRHFVFIHNDAIEDDEEPTLDWALEKAADAVIRHGLNVLIFDPWNEIEHKRRRDQSLTEYIGDAIKKMKRFARFYNVLVIVVIHPTKEGGLKEKMSLYDAADSANWVNKADYGIIIERDYGGNLTKCVVNKVRYRPTGRRGETSFVYIPELELFSQ